MLITATEIISLAYITNLDEKLIKDQVIDVAEKSYISPILGSDFFKQVSNDPASYSTLVDTFIKPCIAFFVKYLIYSQQLFETAAYSNPDPTKAPELIDPASAPLINSYVHQNIIKDILFIARQKEQLLKEHLDSYAYEGYEKPVLKRINGFLIKTSES
ncbi:MAG: hypothetical protein KQI35_01155 [Bacteroidetes bacterium]|nr:hypothetical protein [Bacteroidota bacterium]